MSGSVNYHPKQILCPVDMSDLSDLALKYAQVGARMFDAELTVLNAMHFEYPRYLSKELTDHVLKELEHVKSDVRKRIAEHTRAVLGEGAERTAIHYRAVDTTPAQAVITAAEESKADLVVMGTHGYSGFKHWMLGSVAEKVLHLSRVPVFTIRQKSDDFIDTANPDSRPRIDRILCPCNQSASAARALAVAASLANRMNARLTVLQSVESPSASDKDRLTQWLDEHLPKGLSVETVIRSGEAADQTISAAKELDSDLIVVGISHRPFGEGTVVGRTSMRVARHAPVPVLSVPYFTELLQE